MASAERYDSFKVYVTCFVCFQEFINRKPRRLRCQHVFCEECLQRLLDCRNENSANRNNALHCPICRRTTDVVDGRALNLPPHLDPEKVDYVKQRLDQKPPKCDGCKNDSIASIAAYCFQCAAVHCESCAAVHERSDGDHKQTRISAHSLCYMTCQRHGRHVESFCLKCRDAICSICYQSKHGDHKVYRLSYANKLELTQIIEDVLRNKLQSVVCIMESLHLAEADYRIESEKTKQLLKLYKESAISEVLKQYASFCEQVDHEQDEVGKYLTGCKQETKQANDTIVHILQELDKVWQSEVSITDWDLITLSTILSDIFNKLQLIEASTKRLEILKFVPSSVPFGGITTQGLPAAARLTEPVLTWEVQTDDVYDLDYLPSGHLVVVGKSGLTVYKQDGQKDVHILTNLCSGNLQGLSVSKTLSVIAVIQDCGSDRPGLLHLNKTDVQSLQHQQLEICPSPRKVAITRSGNFIVYNIHRKLYKYDEFGHLLWHRCLPSPLHDMCIDQCDRLLACHTENVRVYNMNGEKLFSFKTNDIKIEPRAVCVDSDNNILVCDHISISVLLFDDHGSYMRKILTLESIPWFISLYGNRILAVDVYDEPDRLCIYRI